MEMQLELIIAAIFLIMALVFAYVTRSHSKDIREAIDAAKNQAPQFVVDAMQDALTTALLAADRNRYEAVIATPGDEDDRAYERARQEIFAFIEATLGDEGKEVVEKIKAARPLTLKQVDDTIFGSDSKS